MSAAGSKRKVAAFDPKETLADVVPNKHKKKRASTSSGRALRLTVCRLPSFRVSIPKGKNRNTLKEQGRIVDVRLTRSMSATVARDTINRCFVNLGDEWDYLDSGQDNILTMAMDQTPCGDVLCSRKSIYIVDRKVHSVPLLIGFILSNLAKN